MFDLHALFNKLAYMLAFGLIHNLIVTIPPQHGKSEYWSKYFTAWYLGTFPDHRVVLASYAGNYAASWGRKSRDLLDDHGQEIFGVSVAQDAHRKDDWSIAGRQGGMITAGVDGSITGRGADLGIVDDPIKNHNEAFSKTAKDKIWDWWDSTFSSRIHEGAKKLVIATRWAEDDLTGRLLDLKKRGLEDWTVVTLPALAEEDESILGFTRKKGEALCPEIYSTATLEARRRKTAPFWWATMYQGQPYQRDGDTFKRDWFRKVDVVPDYFLKCRSWDLAASTKPTAKRTAGMLMVRTKIDSYCVANAVKGRWAPGRRNKIIRRIAELDGHDVPIIIEQEPGSGGMAQIDELKRILDGFAVYSVNASTAGSKILRADAMSGQAELGFVSMKRAKWNDEFLDEAASFPGGKTIDMIDAAANGYNWLAAQEGPTNVPENYDPMAGVESQMFGSSAGGRLF